MYLNIRNDILGKIWQYRWVLRSFPYTLYFNFHYLPFNQAIKLPILLYKPKLLKCRGTVRIEGEIKTGMIQLGRYNVSLYPNTGIVYENHGGNIIFRGGANIGNHSAISIGSSGNLIIGDRFNATASFKLASYHHIEFKENVLIGWDCLFMDTDFHQLTVKGNVSKSKPFGKIIIGSNCWFALKAVVTKGTILADNNVVAANSLLNKDYGEAQYCLFAGQPANIKKTNVYRNPQNDRFEY